MKNNKTRKKNLIDSALCWCIITKDFHIYFGIRVCREEIRRYIFLNCQQLFLDFLGTDRPNWQNWHTVTVRAVKQARWSVNINEKQNWFIVFSLSQEICTTPLYLHLEVYANRIEDNWRISQLIGRIFYVYCMHISIFWNKTGI